MFGMKHDLAYSIRYSAYGQFSKVQSGKRAPAPGISELSKVILNR